MTAAELSSVLDHAIQLALTSDDELFHYRYYDWLLEQDKTMLLLEVGRKGMSYSDVVLLANILLPKYDF